jgi:hypothetical protein
MALQTKASEQVKLTVQITNSTVQNLLEQLLFIQKHYFSVHTKVCRQTLS